jgi:chemotaxis protein MotB
MTGCISQKKFNAQVSKYDSLKTSFDKVDLMLSDCIEESKKKQSRIGNLEEELSFAKKSSGAMLQQLSDLSVISATQAESIKKSLENINAKEGYIRNLQTELSRKDSLNMALVLNLKGALKDVNDDDININVEGSAVFISISDKMLFKSGSYEITPRAKEVLGKVADVIKAQPDVQFMVEGHTDNKSIATSNVRDNWDLSVLRSASVVRTLQKQYDVDPARMIAAGRSEYVPVVSNDTPEGRSTNRRTRIVILPQLDQFFKLMEPNP